LTSLVSQSIEQSKPDAPEPSPSIAVLSCTFGERHITSLMPFRPPEGKGSPVVVYLDRPTSQPADDS
jgi:hypothetical protein